MASPARTIAMETLIDQLQSNCERSFSDARAMPPGVGQVHIRFGGGLAPEFIADPEANAHMSTLKTLLDEVNAEDRRGVEAGFRGVHAPLAKPGNLSHLERPNFDFARYIAAKLAQH